MFLSKNSVKSNQTIHKNKELSQNRGVKEDHSKTASVDDQWFEERHHNEVSFGLRIDSILYSKQSRYQKVEVLDSVGFGRILTLDGCMMCSDKDEFVYHELIAHIPLLSHPNPTKVLIIGGGDCGTLREVLRHNCVKHVDMVEIDGDVVEICQKYFPQFHEGYHDPRANIRIEDGIEFVKNSSNATYDIVIIDSADPVGPGVGLFTEEFYKQVRRILKSDGIVIAQCESPWEEKWDLSKIYGNLKSAFSKVYSIVGSIPSYPYGYWSWAIASENIHPVHNIQMERAQKIEKKCQYYNVEIHRSVFALPNFFKKKLAHIVENAREELDR